MRTFAPATALVAALCLICGATAQRNFVDDGGFDYPEAAPARAAPRPAPAYRPNSFSDAPKPTPVPIIKQINRHNEDGSYTYGYEGADGSFKIETKLASGDVMGKYGYVDDVGKVRVVEYGANKYGFQPAGEGITVAAPTLVDETATQKNRKAGPLSSSDPVEYDDGQFYEEVPVRAAAPRPVARPAPRPAPRPQPRPAPQPQYSQDSFTSFQSSQNFGPSRPVSSQSSLGPVPPRAAIPGAAPIGPAPSFSQPRPQAAPRPAPRPQQSFFSPAPAAASASPAPVYEPSNFQSRSNDFQQPQPSRASYGRSSGILDQLQKDFALPSNSAPALHDITFGSF